MTERKSRAKAVEDWAVALWAQAEADEFAVACEVIQAGVDSSQCVEVGRQHVDKTVELVELSPYLDLSAQTYDPQDSNARYVVVFGAAGQLYFDSEGDLDFAELLYCFFHLDLDFSHPNKSLFEPDELAELEGLMRRDFGFDHAEDELSLSFESNRHGLRLVASVAR
jgi:hypothetical protein